MTDDNRFEWDRDGEPRLRRCKVCGELYEAYDLDEPCRCQDGIIDQGEIAYDLSPEEVAEFEEGINDGIEEIPF